MFRFLALLGVLLTTSAMATSPTVTIYSYRQPFLIEPILAQFTEQTGIKTEVVFAKSGLDERLRREGALTPADFVLTTDISRLAGLVAMGLTQPVNSEILAANVPEHYRDPADHWFALTLRVRNVYSSKARVGKANLSYEDLAKPEYQGKLCTRSGKNAYNIALVASMIAHHGEEHTEQWLHGLKANLARKPQGNDRAQIKAVAEGICDYAIGNSYYFGKMLSDPNQQPFAEQVEINFPNQQDRGAHINVSGAVMTKYAKQPQAAQTLLEFLSAPLAQQQYAEVNMEYPVNPAVSPSSLVRSWGEYQADTLPIHRLAQHHKAAITLLDKVQFDL